MARRALTRELRFRYVSSDYVDFLLFENESSSPDFKPKLILYSSSIASGINETLLLLPLLPVHIGQAITSPSSFITRIVALQKHDSQNAKQCWLPVEFLVNKFSGTALCMSILFGTMI